MVEDAVVEEAVAEPWSRDRGHDVVRDAVVDAVVEDCGRDEVEVPGRVDVVAGDNVVDSWPCDAFRGRGG